jgi:putative transposase
MHTGFTSYKVDKLSRTYNRLYKFKQKAFEFGKQVIEVNEAYTSKTNNFTGKINNKLGSKEFIEVGSKKMDRDINGALGILLRALGDSPCLETNSVVNKY